MLWIIYNLLFLVAFVLMLPYYLMRMRRRGGYRQDFKHRFGRYDDDLLKGFKDTSRIWVHGVSVGEVFVAMKIMEELRQREPDARFVLSVTTSTAHAIARARLSPDDILIYFPLDLPWIMKRVVYVMNPRMLILIECEFWPNLLRRLHKRGVPVALVNGRISDSSFKGYARLRAFTRRIFPIINPVCMQSRTDHDRMVDLGCPPSHVHHLGSAKYDVAEGDPEKEAGIGQALEAAGFGAGRILFLGGSTWDGEEAVLIDLYLSLKKQHPELALVLAPRHFERTDEVLRLLAEKKLKVFQRSLQCKKVEQAPEADVYLIDTTGELRFFYAHAGLIFIGKSLTQDGGQNPIEAALYGKAVLVGPNMQNFPLVMKDFLSADALVQVADAAELEQAAASLLAEPDQREALGRRSADLVRSRQGVVKASADLLVEKL